MSTWPSISDIAEGVKTGKLKSKDLVEQSLKVIDEKNEYKAIIAKTEKRAKERAAEIDRMAAQGQDVGRLAGVPFIAKDNFLAYGADTTAASNILKGFDAPYQATAIEKLEAEGAICVAKANLDAFAHGSSTENSDFFTTLNPHDKQRVPGGSSGGSATAVVLEMVPFTVGTDTGGSIRQPASFSGCVGYKPTYGLVSRNGVVAMGSSLDVIGPLAKTVEDAALVLDVMAGKDILDSTTIERDPKSYEVTGYSEQAKGKKVGVIKEYLGKGLDKDVKNRIEESIRKLSEAGAEIKEVSLPSLPLALAVYYIICPAEVSSNLSRYDGQRFGYSFNIARTCPHAKHEAPHGLKEHRGVDSSSTPSSYHSYDSVHASDSSSAASLCKNCKRLQKNLTLDDSYKLSRSFGFGKEAKRRIMIGTYVLSSGYYDAYYKKAQVVRTKLIKEFEEAFKEVDFLLGPTTPTTAFKIGENAHDPLKMYLSDIMTVAANLVGAPAISIPAGNIDGLPVGLQLIAPQKHDQELLQLSKAAQEVIA